MAAPELNLTDRRRDEVDATLGDPWPGRASPDVPPPPGQAAERLTTYFHALGLSDRRCLAETARDVLEHLAVGTTELQMHDLPQCAIEVAVRRMERWLDALVAPTPGAAGAAVARGLVLWRLRGPLGSYPEAFLSRAGLPDAFRRAIEASAVPIVPDDKPAPMPPQQLSSRRYFVRSTFGHWLESHLGPFRQKERTTLTGA